MRKIILCFAVIVMLALSACKESNSSSETENKQNSSNTNAIGNSANVHAIGGSASDKLGENNSTQILPEALKYFPADFQEALEIETKRQEVLLTGSRADAGNATYEAFDKMKALNSSYCEKIKGKLSDSQKTAFVDFLEKEKQYNIAFDMFTSKVISQQVYAGGNADCSEEYNLIRTNTLEMYCLYSLLCGRTLNADEINNAMQEQLKGYLFFNDNTKDFEGKSTAELIAINSSNSPLLRNVLSSTSQSVFDNFKTSFDNYINSLERFEQSISVKSENSNSYKFAVKLNTAIVCNLYSSLKDMEYLDGMLEKFNFEVNQDDYAKMWN